MPGVAITSTLPTVGSTAGPTWASQLIAWCNEVEGDLEASVVPSEIDVNANFEFNGYKATEMGGVKFNSGSTASTGSGNANLIEVVSGELYYTDGNGSSIQLTSGGSINLSTTGGISGNYTTTSADCNFSSANRKYTFTDQDAKPAKIDCSDVLVRENALSANSVTIKSPASLGTSYTVELFDTGAGTGTYVTTGVYSGGTIKLTPSRDLSVDTILTTGVGTFTNGIKAKASGDGSTTLDFFHEAGTTSSSLGWTPVLVFGSSPTITYNKRYAWVQRVGDWAHVSASIGFQVDATTAGTTVKITGLPYKAMGDSYTSTPGESQGYIVAGGVCMEFPKTTNNTGATGSPATVVAAIYDEDDEIFFFDRAVNYDDTANGNPSYDGGLTFPATGTITPDRGASIVMTSSRYYRISFQISYRVSA